MKQEKTASEWFDMLIEPYCSQAKENVNFQELRQFHPNLHCAIGGSFTWVETKQGAEYWDIVYESTRNNETTYLKPTEPAQPQFGEWVKVGGDNVPPNEGENVLLYSKQSEYVGVGYLSFIGWKNANDDFVNNITHYMPLPPNPKD